MNRTLSNFVIALLFFNIGASAQIVYSYGTYVGNGTAVSIDWIGFQPEVILVKSASTHAGWIATSDMPAGEAKSLAGSSSLATGIITSIDANGFTVSTSTQSNNSGTTYYFLAFNAGADLVTGSYVGDNSVPQTVTSGLAFAPQMIWILGDAGGGSDQALLGCASNTNMSVKWADGVYTGTNGIYSYDANGFKVGDDVNNNTKTYYYVAFNESGTNLKDATYAPDGFDGYEVTGPGFQPDVVLVSHNGNLGGPVLRTASMVGDAAVKPGYATAIGADLIQSFTANGFTVGSTTVTNWGGGGYSYMAMSGGNTLPVELISFEAKKENERVLLNWSTASEINSDYYDIMKSADGNTYESIGKVEAAGNSNKTLHYSFSDDAPVSGTNYYKLIEHDKDGQEQKSKIVAVNFTTKTNVITQLYPNPTSDKIILYFNSETGGLYRLTVVDLNGNTQYFAHIPAMIGENKFTLSLANLATGQYLINLIDSNENHSSMRFVKSE